jgi:hypothetical protein
MATMATKPAANPIHWGRGQGAGRAGGAGGTAAVAHDIEIAAQLVGVGIAAGWILAQGVGHDGGELAGDLYRRPIQITRFALVEDFGGGNRDGRAAEGMLTGEHLVEDDAEREDVGASVGRLAAEHFGGHVDGRAGHDAPFGESLGGCRGPGGIGAGKAAGDSEVEQLDLAGSGEHDVFRLDIAVENGGCGLLVFLVGAFEVLDGSVLEVPDAGRDFVDEVVVMCDEKDRSLVFLQRDVEGVDGFEVEVVGGLIEDKQVGFEEHELAEDEARGFSAGECVVGLRPSSPRKSIWPRMPRMSSVVALASN